jgi:hypothetical protein
MTAVVTACLLLQLQQPQITYVAAAPQVRQVQVHNTTAWAAVSACLFACFPAIVLLPLTQMPAPLQMLMMQQSLSRLWHDDTGCVCQLCMLHTCNSEHVIISGHNCAWGVAGPGCFCACCWITLYTHDVYDRCLSCAARAAAAAVVNPTTAPVRRGRPGEAETASSALCVYCYMSST